MTQTTSTGNQNRDQRSPSAPDQRAPIAQPAVEDDAAFDPELSLGASINESLMAPGLTTRESGLDFGRSDAMGAVSPTSSEISDTPHQGLDSDMGAPTAQMTMGMDQDPSSISGSTQASGASRDAGEGMGLMGQETAAGPQAQQETGPSSDSKAQQQIWAERWQRVSGDVKTRASQVDKNIKSQPYPFVLGAVGLGFALGRMLASDRHVQS